MASLSEAAAAPASSSHLANAADVSEEATTFVADAATDYAPKSVLITGGAGFITAAMLSARLPPPGEKNKVFVCGPPGMMKVGSGAKVSPKDQGEVLGHRKALGYDKDMVFKF